MEPFWLNFFHFGSICLPLEGVFWDHLGPERTLARGNLPGATWISEVTFDRFLVWKLPCALGDNFDLEAPLAACALGTTSLFLFLPPPYLSALSVRRVGAEGRCRVSGWVPGIVANSANSWPSRDKRGKTAPKQYQLLAKSLPKNTQSIAKSC